MIGLYKDVPVRDGILMLVTVLLMFSAPVATAQPAVPDSEDCLDCHDEMGSTLKGTAHQLNASEDRAIPPVSCQSCHTGAAVHLEDPQVGNIGNPAEQLSGQIESLCTSCHQQHVHSGVAGFDPHLNQTTSCTDCHQIHGNHQGLLFDEDGAFCAGCHVAVENQFGHRSNHPLTDQAVTCLSCHDFTGSNDVGFGHGNNANCYRCHPQQAGPYRYEHQAGSSFATEGEGCTTCHQPHGSPNERLLTQAGDGLCRQCHGVLPLHLTTHNGVGANFTCVECHSQVHGSYDNRAFLDPDIGTKIGDEPGSCYCHFVNEN